MHIARTVFAGALALSLSVGCSQEPDPNDPGDPGPLGEAVRRALIGIGTSPNPASGLEYRIYQLDGTELHGEVTAESCDAVDSALVEVCSELEGADYCSYDTRFFYAHQIPRCAVRFHAYSNADESYVWPMYVLDFSGTAIEGPAPTCGNGVLDEGEECDDGNQENWDGCDAQCNPEPFNGCEAVIQDYFQQADLAMVDQNQWDGPRTHLMVNRSVVPLREVTRASCDASLAVATDVCNQLGVQMPFVGSCWASGKFHEEGGEPACSIRLNVWFQQLDPGAGVYTTGLDGVLAFTIR
ncbi:MAG TPA: hypothetical protein VML75_16330 [Kofleriaceae bacterium]|nr:hypothetical protein [Kofleriaceae bacterium]